MAPRRKPQSETPEIGRRVTPAESRERGIRDNPKAAAEMIDAARDEIRNLKDTLAAKDLAEQQAKAARERAARPGLVDRIKNKIEEVAGPARDVLVGSAVKALVNKEEKLQKYIDLSTERYKDMSKKKGADSDAAGIARQLTEAKKELASVTKARASMARLGKAAGYNPKAKKKK